MGRKLDKPVVFFSHSPSDRVYVTRLQQMLAELTGGTLDIFVSSDGQSIPFGRNWVSTLEDALRSAKLMFVFLSPRSLASQWIYFESGHAFARGINVIPVGILGVDLTVLRPPISLLQGYNITSSDGLNNVVASLNAVFKTTFKRSFTPDDYTKLAQDSAIPDSGPLAGFGHLIGDVTGKLREKFAEFVTRAVAYCKSNDIEHHATDRQLRIHGLEARRERDDDEPQGPAIAIHVDPKAIDGVSKILDAIVVVPVGGNGLSLKLHLGPAIRLLDGAHKVSGRLSGGDVKLIGAGEFSYLGLPFALYESRRGAPFVIRDDDVEREVIVSIALGEMKLANAPIPQLLKLLLDREVLILP